MKTYRLALSIGGVSYVEADRHEEVGGKILFYRGEVIHAEYAKATVKDLTEPTMTQRLARFRSGIGPDPQSPEANTAAPQPAP